MFVVNMLPPAALPTTFLSVHRNADPPLNVVSWVLKVPTKTALSPPQTRCLVDHGPDVSPSSLPAISSGYNDPVS